MARTVRITEEMIIEAGVRLVLEAGLSALNARSLAARLHCSISRSSAISAAWNRCGTPFCAGSTAFTPASSSSASTKATGFTISRAHIALAQAEKHLFHAMFLTKLYGTPPWRRSCSRAGTARRSTAPAVQYGLSTADAEAVYRDVRFMRSASRWAHTPARWRSRPEKPTRCCGAQSSASPRRTHGKRRLSMKTNETRMRELRAWLAQTESTPLEEMDAFFTRRLSGYEAHMLAHWAADYRTSPPRCPPMRSAFSTSAAARGWSSTRFSGASRRCASPASIFRPRCSSGCAEKHGGRALELICGSYFGGFPRPVRRRRLLRIAPPFHGGRKAAALSEDLQSARAGRRVPKRRLLRLLPGGGETLLRATPRAPARGGGHPAGAVRPLRHAADGRARNAGAVRGGLFPRFCRRADRRRSRALRPKGVKHGRLLARRGIFHAGASAGALI